MASPIDDLGSSTDGESPPAFFQKQKGILPRPLSKCTKLMKKQVEVCGPPFQKQKSTPSAVVDNRGQAHCLLDNGQKLSVYKRSMAALYAHVKTTNSKPKPRPMYHI